MPTGPDKPAARALPAELGAYELIEALGRGGTGAAYLALHRDSGELVVVKCLHERFGDDDRFLKRFRHEAALAVEVDSPHIARCYDVGSHEGTPYIVMEYIPGWSLSKLISLHRNDKRRLTVATAIGLSVDLLNGLDDIHSAVDRRTKEPLGFIHRDIKPANLIVEPTGQLRIIDLGLGKSTLQDWKTRTGAVMGTPGYMAPEQVLAAPTDPRTDLYSAATVTFELLTLTRRVPRGPTPQMMLQCAAPEFKPPSTFRSDVPPALDDVLARALAVEPEGRYGTAGELARALLAAAGYKRNELVVDVSYIATSERMDALDATKVRAEGRATTASPEGATTTYVFASRPIEDTLAIPEQAPSPPYGVWASLVVVVALTTALFTVVALDQDQPTSNLLPVQYREVVEEAPPIAPVVAPKPAAPRVTTTSEPEAAPAPTKRARRRVQRRRVPPPPPPPPPPTEPVAPPPAERLTVAKLSALANQIRQRRPDRAKQIDAVLGDVTMWANAEDSERAQSALRGLRRRLWDIDR